MGRGLVFGCVLVVLRLRQSLPGSYAGLHVVIMLSSGVRGLCDGSLSNQIKLLRLRVKLRLLAHGPALTDPRGSIYSSILELSPKRPSPLWPLGTSFHDSGVSGPSWDLNPTAK